ncbi:RimK family alpha-L-glutamate ligase [Streptomyces sp. ITFR-6]|uniref:RimK family alpha-L-glutamate ligase n=1 Tax=Streptomyces sp. ITFR-6 TaxID=3075197 RepID=UPI00288A771B|nr:RimK family alpha-L-glutamate ligase [Streptomyces sp. ITFR-6]WNI32330.1 RimK family alpha-L-glutamate ligase [Streptomyces sp. ITFR-6]
MTGDGGRVRSSYPVVLIATRIRAEERMLLEAFRRRAVSCVHVDDRSLVYRVGGPPPEWRAVLNRAISATRRIEVSRLYEALDIPVFNSLATLTCCSSKIAGSLALHHAGLPIPATAIALDAASGGAAVAEVGFPAVVKPVVGSWGRGLAKVNDADAAEAVFGLRDQLPSPVQKLPYTQEFVRGRDIRVLVVGGRAVAAIERAGEHWVRNTARGGQARACVLDPGLTELAEGAAAAVGGGILGVDLLETDQGSRLVIEVNGGVEFHGLAAAHPGIPVADVMIDYVLGRTP